MANYTVVAEVGNRIEVQKREDRKNYYAYYRDNGGKQKNPSLKTRDKKQAVERAQEIYRSLENETHDRIQEVKANRGKTFADAVASYLEIEVPRQAESGFKQVKGRLERLCGGPTKKPLHET